MTTNSYRKLIYGGGFNLPYLVHIYNAAETENVYLINDNADVVYENNTYKASSFNFSINADGSATLEVELVGSGNALINIFENNYNFTAEVVGVMRETGVEVLTKSRHNYGEATWDGRKATISFSKDERINMTFPALVWSTYSNRGNS